MDSLTKDITSRNRIVSEIDKNFFVEAGAGSGKTTMLVNRMVAMVEKGVDIKRIIIPQHATTEMSIIQITNNNN